MSIQSISPFISIPTAVGYIRYSASEGLMNLLKANRIRPITKAKHFVKGSKQYFRNQGTCTIGFLPDGRIHVLDAPIAPWSLHDSLSSDELRILIAYCGMAEEFQSSMRESVAPYCDSIIDIMHRLPRINAPWKQFFLKAYRNVELC